MNSCIERGMVSPVGRCLTRYRPAIPCIIGDNPTHFVLSVLSELCLVSVCLSTSSFKNYCPH